MTAAVHIHRPATFPLRRIARCPHCKQRRRIAGVDAAWYGPTWTCCHCGDSWSDGEMLSRPFERGWRQRAVTRAKATWAAGAGLTREDHHAWLHAEIHGDDIAL